MIGCLVLPFILASINMMTTAFIGANWCSTCGSICAILTFPFFPFVLIALEQKTLMELSYCAKDQAELLISRYKSIKLQLSRFLKTELSIETSMQICFSVLLLLFSKSETRTAQGLEAIFDGSQYKILGLPPEVFLVLNNIWSVISSSRAFVKGMSATKDHFPMKAILVLGLYVLLSLFSKTFACVIYFTPCLGLFNLMRHYQGELLPHWAAMEFDYTSPNVNVSDALVYYSTAEPFPWNELTRFNYTDPRNPTNPTISIYTYFELETYLYGFYVIMLCQAIIIMITKELVNPKPFKRNNVIQNFTHALENCQVVAPMEDWDDAFGSIEDYIEAQMLVSFEVGVTLTLNLLIHLLMSVPMVIFAYNVHQRQLILEKSIGSFPEEDNAYRLSIILAAISPIILIICTILQFITYQFYNKRLHPFIELVKDYKIDADDVNDDDFDRENCANRAFESYENRAFEEESNESTFDMENIINDLVSLNGVSRGLDVNQEQELPESQELSRRYSLPSAQAKNMPDLDEQDFEIIEQTKL